MKNSKNPLLSVILPTYKRPMLLKRAIDSALQSAPGGDVEVVVVPNGADDSWKDIAEERKSDLRIKWFYLSKGHACAARNYGLSMSCGKYVRFLDDDDVLLQEASNQLEMLDLAGAEISSAPLLITFADNIDGFGRIASLPDTADFYVAALRSVGVGMTEGSVFLRSAVVEKKWREDSTLYDDYLWIISLAKEREWFWVRHEAPVGEYYQHFFGDRLSRLNRSEFHLRKLVDAIIEKSSSPLSEDRKEAVAAALLSYAHSAFPACPLYLSRVINDARAISSSAVPMHPIFKNNAWLSRNMITLEWILLPLRYASQYNRHIYQRVRRILAS